MDKSRKETGREAGSREGPRLVKFAVTAVWMNTIPFKVMRARGWKHVGIDEDPDFIYADVGFVHENITYGNPVAGGFRLAEGQRINHFPNHVELTRKDLMAKNLKRAVKQAQREGSYAEAAALEFFPLTFTLPNEGQMMLRAFREVGGVWIFKPVGRAQGKGIFLVSKPAQVEAWLRDRALAQKSGDCSRDNVESYVVQRYIHNPYLVGGKKFDLRIYALVLSFQPLRVYLYREGFARFTNARFSLNREDLSNTFVHLTNHAVQKKDNAYDPSTTDLKWPIHSLKLHMLSKHGVEATNDCFGKIQDIIIGSLRAVAPVIINDRHCVELYGYDVMVDADLKPWLIEVNASPSLSSDTQQDYDLKFRLIDDMLTCLDMEGAFDGNVPRTVGGFDLIYDKDTVVRNSDFPSLPTALGCMNDRAKSLKKLQRAAAAAQSAKAAAAAAAGAGAGGGAGVGGGPSSGVTATAT